MNRSVSFVVDQLDLKLIAATPYEPTQEFGFLDELDADGKDTANVSFVFDSVFHSAPIQLVVNFFEREKSRISFNWEHRGSRGFG